LDTLGREGWISSSATGMQRRVVPTSRISKAQETYSVGVLIPRPLDALLSATQHFLRDLATITSPDRITFVYHHSASGFLTTSAFLPSAPIQC